MKRVSVILSLSVVLILISCNNGTTKEEAKTPDTTAASSTSQAEVKPAFTPFKILVIQHKVKDFNKAVAGYFSRDSLLKAYGLTHLIIGRDLKDSNQVFIVDKVEDVEKSKDFFNQAKVKEAMAKAGVSRAPGYSYGEMIRANESPRNSNLGVSISHHVKDFDTWVKAFDAEGPDARAANGLIDRGMARDFYDPNTVYLTFEVSDSAKARARMTSPELKKIMADAGVDSPPTTRWFRVIQ
jgi:hypothetical protein